jgi:hypoxanthine phosphoribosyltransferase
MYTQQIDPKLYLDRAELIHSKEAVDAAIDQLAGQISASLGDSNPVVLCVMGGAVIFSGQLLPRLGFPLVFDYVQVSRYHNQTQGQQLIWKMLPGDNIHGRTVLVLDDILDEGHTLAAIKEKCLEQGAEKVVIAVLAEKQLNHPKPIAADFVGLQLPNRYVFGCGMDVYGWWRNLPAIYALAEDA